LRRTNRIPFWLCFLFTALFIAGAASSASADTIGPAFDSYSPANGARLPGGWVTVEARVLDADGIQSGSQQLTINSQAVPAVLNYDVKSVDPVTETVIYDYTHAVITYRALYSDRTNNVQLTVKDNAGNISTLNWTFEVATAPAISNLTPAPNTATTNTTPAISATVTHPGGGAIDPASVVMTVNGQPVSVTHDTVTGLVSYTPSAPLTVSETYTVTVTAADTNNHSSTAQWNFSVVYPDMPVPNTKPDCLRCHTSQPQSHRMGNCAACHDVALRKIYASQSPPPHFVAYSCNACHITRSHDNGAIAGQPAWYPIDVKYNCNQCHQHNTGTVTTFHKTTTTGCEQCHSTALTREHYRPGRTDKLGNPVDCFTCHTSARPEVQQAIAAKNTACAACHPAGHTASHTNATFTGLAKDPDMDCAQCHNSDIANEHTTRTDALGVNYTCDTCHKSSVTEVVYAINTKNKNCEACHVDPVTKQPAVHTRSGPPLHDTTYAVTRDLACEQCHAGNIKTVHVGQPNKLANNALMNCDTCHKSANPAVQAALVARDTKCDACHTTRHANVTHSFPAGYVLNNPNNLRCADCHQGTALTDLHVNKVTKTGVTMTCDTCHGSAAPVNVKTAVANNQTTCDACHAVHTNDTAAHTTALSTNPVDCNDCHKPAVNQEHAARKDAAGNPYDCNTCHNSARSDVQTAIATGDASCIKCHASIHPGTQYIPAHETRLKTQPAVSCNACHNPNLVNLHSNYTLGCDTCHNSVKAEVRTAIKNLDTDCNSCHINPVRHTTANLDTRHTSTYIPNPQLDCRQCHSNLLSTEHAGRQSKTNPGQTINCDSCHTSADAAVRNAITNRQTNCDACHTVHPNDAAAHTNPAFTALVKDPDMDCALCHTNVISAEHTARKDAAGLNYTCGTCHNSTRTEVKTAISNKNKNCEACHIDPATQQPTVHTKSGPPLHDTTYMPDPEVNCRQCHVDNLKNGHVGRINTATNLAMDCATCHKSNIPAVAQAITAKNTGCTACHAYPPARHQPKHLTNVYTTDTTRTDDCSLCHSKAIKDEHVGRTIATGGVMNCNTCHTSADPKVVSAVSTKQTNSCEACHTLHPVKDVTLIHDSVNFTAKTYTDPNMNCSNCHNKSLSAEHVNKTTEAGVTMNCDTCHQSARPDVQNAIATNNLKCEACHTKVHTSPDPSHATTFAANKTIACEKCHDANSIANDHTKFKTSAGAAITCSTCHQSTDTKVINAIRTSNTGCDTCHTTRHTDVQGPHKSTYIPNTTYNCSNCHAAANIAYNMTASYHKIAGVTPTANLLHGGAFVSPWTATSTLTCRDCHNKNTSTNTYYGKLLKGAYTATTGKQGSSTANQLCFFCHATSAYGPGSSRSANSGFKGDGSTNWHAIGNHTEKGGCMSCHNAKPHSGGKQGLIAIKGTTEPNSLITAFTHTTSYSKSSCTTSCH